MFGGMNPAKMQGMMKKMGISQTQLPVKRVIFEMEDKNLIIEEPQVVNIKMQGQESYQVTGDAKEENSEPEFTDEDIQMVAKHTGKTEEEARHALETRKGDIAEAIIYLQE